MTDIEDRRRQDRFTLHARRDYERVGAMAIRISITVIIITATIYMVMR